MKPDDDERCVCGHLAVDHPFGNCDSYDCPCEEFLSEAEEKLRLFYEMAEDLARYRRRLQ